ncbi:MAG: MaoC family dehydratase, partial [Patescibacteria group bacterium]
MEFSEIEIGAVYSFAKIVSRDDVLKFAGLSGDFNPLHVDPAFGERNIFKANVVHGMLLGSFFSALVGMYCPGEKSLYLSQTLNFKLPVFIGDSIIVKSTVMDKSESIKIIVLKTEILKQDQVAVYGEARVKVLDESFNFFDMKTAIV